MFLLSLPFLFRRSYTPQHTHLYDFHPLQHSDPSSFLCSLTLLNPLYLHEYLSLFLSQPLPLTSHLLPFPSISLLFQHYSFVPLNSTSLSLLTPYTTIPLPTPLLHIPVPIQSLSLPNPREASFACYHKLGRLSRASL